jgi:1-acyl-sn-glycerol-3-phosphate acyltransferase
MNEACSLLASGRSVGVFPEGTYSPQDGTFHDLHTGAARLALKTGAAVMPVGIHLICKKSFHFSIKVKGTPMAGYWYLYGPYVMTVGEPVYFHGDAENKEDIKAATQQMMAMIRALARESESRLQKSASVSKSFHQRG